jgi:hypothetical protein
VDFEDEEAIRVCAVFVVATTGDEIVAKVLHYAVDDKSSASLVEALARLMCVRATA